MNLGKILGGAAGAIVGPVADYLKRRAELKAAKHQAELAATVAAGERAAKAISEGLAADAGWELESLRAHAGGWKDEFVLVVLALPLVGCFIPSVAPHVLRGFEILDSTPSYFRLLVVVVFGAIYGVRMWRRQQYDTE
jgi:hypothetical protein